MRRKWTERTIRRSLVLAVTTCATAGGDFASVAEADIIVGYGPENAAESSSALDILAGVTALPLTRGEGLNAGTGNTFNSSGWTDEPTDYLQWGWTSSSPIDLTDLDLRYDRSNSGPSDVEIQLAVDGGSFQSILVDSDVATSGEDVLDVDLTSFTGVTSATFRLMGSGASSASGTFDIEALSGVSPERGILVNGTAAAVPEPSGLLMSLLGLLGMTAECLRLRSIAKNPIA